MPCCSPFEQWSVVAPARTSSNATSTPLLRPRPGGGGLKRYRDPSVCLSHGAAELPRLQTVESYMVIICQQSLSDNSHTCYYRYSITRSLFHSRLKTFLFCKSFPLQPFLFSFRIHYMDFPDCLLLLLSIFRLLLFSFSVLTLFSCPFRAVD